MPPPSSPEPALHEARKALHCLHLAVDGGHGIVEDVTAKVEAAFAALAAPPSSTPKGK